MQLPSQEIMHQMAKLANEQATIMIAKFARQFAQQQSIKQLNGQDALLAFADAIESTNAKVWPKEG
jgi:hypothetical protein